MKTWCLFSLLLALSPAALAFPVGDQFDQDPIHSDGGGGLSFTGAPRQGGLDCAVCHTEAPGRVRVRLEADDPTLFTSGYVSNRTYLLRVLLEGEWLGMGEGRSESTCGDTSATIWTPCNENGFAFEVNDPQGAPVGTLAPVGDDGQCGTPVTGYPDVRVLADGQAVTHSGTRHGLSAWPFCWTAPSQGTGLLGAYVAVVDGNGGDGTSDNPADATGDDTRVAVLRIADAASRQGLVQVGGCELSIASRLDASTIVFALLLSACALRRRFARGALFILIALSLTGCGATVRPWEKEKLAKRIMKFAPDPDEDELDQHMLESREGSAGGYGSSGGGCGCN